MAEFLTMPGVSVAGGQEACSNVTPGWISENYGFTLFRFGTSGAIYLLYEGRLAARLGAWPTGYFGMSFTAADLNRDGIPELYFIVSGGADADSFEVGCFDPRQERVITLHKGRYNDDQEWDLIHEETIVGNASADSGAGFADLEPSFRRRQAGHIRSNAGKIEWVSEW